MGFRGTASRCILRRGNALIHETSSDPDSNRPFLAGHDRMAVPLRGLPGLVHARATRVSRHSAGRARRPRFVDEDSLPRQAHRLQPDADRHGREESDRAVQGHQQDHPESQRHGRAAEHHHCGGCVAQRLVRPPEVLLLDVGRTLHDPRGRAATGAGDVLGAHQFPRGRPADHGEDSGRRHPVFADA